MPLTIRTTSSTRPLDATMEMSMKNCSDAHRDLPSTNSRCLSRFLCVVVFHHTNRNYLVVECSITVKNFGDTWRISGGN